MKAKYNSWSEFVKKEDQSLLDVIPKLDSIDKGNMNFIIEHDGKKYHAAGSHDYISGYNFNPEGSLGVELNFDNFFMAEIGESFEYLEIICSW